MDRQNKEKKRVNKLYTASLTQVDDTGNQIFYFQDEKKNNSTVHNLLVSAGVWNQEVCVWMCV